MLKSKSKKAEGGGNFQWRDNEIELLLAVGTNLRLVKNLRDTTGSQSKPSMRMSEYYFWRNMHKIKMQNTKGNLNTKIR